MQSPFEIDETPAFSWAQIGNIGEGRQNLGEDMPVAVYRLFEYTMRTTLIERFGKETMIETFRSAGKLAGREFAKNMLDLTLDFDAFSAQLSEKMSMMKIGVLRIESFDAETGTATLTVSEDLDCSGLPVTGETVCNYDEGFISGILSEYTGKSYIAIETDCWAKGDRVCRFRADITG